MKVAVIGATGRVGGAVVDFLVKRGHDVIAMTRKLDDERLKKFDAKVKFIEGNVFDKKDLAKLITGTDAVMSGLGPRDWSVQEFNLMAPVMKLMAEVMTEVGAPKRLIHVAGAFALRVAPEGPRLGEVAYPEFKNLYNEHKKTLDNLLETPEDIDWFLACPTYMPPDQKPEGKYRVSKPDIVPENPGNIAPEDCALFMVDELEKHEYSRVIIGCTN